MKIIHLVDDEKFIHFIADIFNSCEDVTNQFLVLVAEPLKPLKHVAALKNMRVIDKHYVQSGNIRSDLVECDALIVHSLDWIKSRVIQQAPATLPIVWSAWGWDYYDLLPSVRNNLIGRDTERLMILLARQAPLMQRLKTQAKQVKRRALQAIMVRKVISRIDFFSAPIPDDFDLIKSHINLTAEYKQINYASVESTFMLGPQEVYGRNILVGNSAAVTNNHIEIFELLSRMELNDRKVVVPLSYGGDGRYIDAVIEHGRKRLGDNFLPIVDTLPLEQYNNLIASCSMVVMGQRRQQAIGNIATMLYKGAKVFLDETVVTYQFLKRRGVFVYGLNDLIEGQSGEFEPLTDAQKRKNNEVLEAFWGHETVLNNASHLVEVLRSHKG